MMMITVLTIPSIVIIIIHCYSLLLFDDGIM